MTIEGKVGLTYEVEDYIEENGKPQSVKFHFVEIFRDTGNFEGIITEEVPPVVTLIDQKDLGLSVGDFVKITIEKQDEN